MQLCKEVLRFLHSIDETGAALQQAVTDVGILPANSEGETEPNTSDLSIRVENLDITVS